MIPIVHGKKVDLNAITLTPDSDVLHFLEPYARAEDPVTADMLIHSTTISDEDRVEMLTTLASRRLENCVGKVYDVSVCGNMVRLPETLVPRTWFWMGVTEVTQAQYEAITGKNPSDFKNPNNPVEEVDWFQAVKFCNLASKRDNLNPAYTIKGKEVTWNEAAEGYRLPIAEEWVMAARTGESQQYSGSRNIEEVGWIISNSKMRPHPVMQLKPNGHGIYDMMGNVFEWGWNSPMSDDRSILGGSWMTDESYCQLGRQFKYIEARKKMPWIGFRLCRIERFLK